MATDQERLVLQMSADLRSFEREMKRARDVTERRMREVEQAALRADKNLSRIMAQAGSNATDAIRRGLANIAPTIAAAFSVQQVTAYADAWTNGRNALAAAGVATEDLAKRQGELVDLANETRTSTEATVALYRRLTIANEELGLSQSQVLRITELLNKSFSASGASSQEAAAAALQLSQALASGVLQGDELRSIRENAPQVAQAIAKAMGVGIGALKDLGAEGKITADVVAGAILAAGDSIEAKFAKTSVTVGQSLQILNNELGRYIGQSDASASASQRVAQAIISLSENLDKLVPIFTVLASLVGTKMVLAFTANSGAMIANGVAAVRLAAFQTAMTAAMTGTTRATLLATTAMRGFGAALVANPLGAAVVAIAALSAGLIYLADKSDKAKAAQSELNGVIAKTDDALANYEQALADAATKSGEARKQALEHAAALRTLAADAVFAAQMLAEQRVEQTKLAADEARAAAAKAARTDRHSRTGSGGGTPGVNVLQSSNAIASGIADRDLAIAIQAELDAVEALGKAKKRYDELNKGGVAAFAPRSTAPVGKADKAAKEDTPPDFDRALERANAELLSARVAAAQTAEERLRLEIARLDADLAARKAEIAKEGYSADQAKKLTDLADERYKVEVAALNAAEATRRAEERQAIAEAQQRVQQAVLDADIEAAQIAAQLATTAKDRRAAELRLLDLTERRERAEAEALAASKDPAEAAIGRIRLDNIARTRAARVQGIERDTAGPWEDYINRLPKSVAEVNEEMQRLAVDGLDSLSDGLANAIVHAEDLGDVAKNVFRQMIADMLAASLRKNFADAGGAILNLIPGFAGFRANGGPVSAGRSYVVGEKRPEVFVPNVSGTILPSVNAATKMAGAKSAASPQATLKMEVNIVGAIGQEGIAAIARREARMGAAMAVQAAQRGLPAAQERQRRLGTSG